MSTHCVFVTQHQIFEKNQSRRNIVSRDSHLAFSATGTARLTDFPNSYKHYNTVNSHKKKCLDPCI